MAKPKYPKEFLELCASVTGKRPKTVIDHILKHGHITTEELKNKYGYDHPPRAARDVRELGIQLETFRVVAANGRKIAAYRFADPTKKQFRRFSGRTGLSKKIKEQLIEKYGCQCFIYLEKMDALKISQRQFPFKGYAFHFNIHQAFYVVWFFRQTVFDFIFKPGSIDEGS